MDGTQFLVQWDEHPSHLATRLGYLLEHQSLVDVTLMCNTHTLKVHRAVLAACSPYFERQLGNHPLIVLKDMKFSVLKSLVEFMYCGETSVSEDNLTPLLEAAKFFEVKGLSSMTKETVCSPSTGHSIKSFNGAPTPTTSGYGRGSGRGRGRGRGRPPLNPSTKIGSPTESAQILLSLSGNSPSPQLYTTSKNVKIDPGSMVSASGSSDIKPKPGFEPRRRGRKRGAINTAFRDRIMRDVDTQMAIENLKRDLSDDGDSPLLSSLLGKSEVKQENSKYVQQLKDIGLPTNVPILIDNGDGKLLSLTEDVLKTVVDSDGNLQLQVAETNVNKVKKSPRPFVVKEMEMQLKSDDEDSSSKASVEIKSEFQEEHINEEVIENLKSGGLSEAELEPDAVVLFEVTDKIEKFVLSAKDVSLLKSLNEQLTKQKKELSDITRNNVSTVDVAGTNTKIAELKLKIGKTKSILSQFVHLKEKLKRFTTNGSEEVNEIEKKEIPQVVHLEIFDGSGEKIKGIELHGTVDKRNIVSKESLAKDSGDYLGLFDMVCDDGGANQNSPLLGENSMKKSKGRETILTGDNCESKEMSYQLVSLDDQTENISYDPIEAMMNDASGNIVIEEKTPDLKYIIDNDGNIMNQDENYVVYESENVIYDNHESILPDVSEGENSSNYVVPERVISNENTEYIVEYNDKTDINDEIKSMEERGQYIVYHDPSKENYEDDVDNGFENNHRDHNFDSTNDDAHNFQNNHVDHSFGNHIDHNFDNVETVKTSYKDNFVIYSHENKDLEMDGEIKTSPTKDVPFAVKLVPLKDTLEKFQPISEHHPRRTRSNSMNGEILVTKRRISSDNSDSIDKKRKIDPTLVDAIPPEESL